jgi:hypothetical protein
MNNDTTTDTMNMIHAFNAFGDALKLMCDHDKFFEHKLEKHWDNPTKLATYLCYRYEKPKGEFLDPWFGCRKPNIDFIKVDNLSMKAIERLKTFGWKIKVGEWPGVGQQLIIMRPDARCYHSNYEW